MDPDILQLLLDGGSDDDVLLWMLADDDDKDDGWRDVVFSLDACTEEQCKTMFRFYREDIYSLCMYLHIPDSIVAENNSKARGIDALCMLLRRFSYPNRLSDLQYIFGRSESELSLLIKAMLNHIYENFSYLVSNMNNRFMQEPYLSRYADAISSKCPLNNVFGFIDGTLRPISRPGQNQRDCFSGHKRIHGIKFQSIMLPSGLIGNMFGPISGRRHDSFMLHESGILPELQN